MKGHVHKKRSLLNEGLLLKEVEKQLELLLPDNRWLRVVKLFRTAAFRRPAAKKAADDAVRAVLKEIQEQAIPKEVVH